MSTFEEYMKLYLQTDVLLLADIMENYRAVSLSNYGLDPLWYLTAPSLSYAACLKYTGIQLQLMTCPTMFNFISKSIRGGLSYIAKRKVEANNRYMEQSSSEKPITFLSYWDMNNLYGKD